ncbi:hypothetical protein EIP86_006302 [Pleurotus ostreatoroseus]|nr:hypothetical protein EIP86_006302 [Pleurotus ostreatoroseus]
MAEIAPASGRAAAVARADEDLLASLGYKQEFQRAFSGLETFGIAFSIIGLLPSIASVLFYSVPNGGPSAMVWGWAVASIFILFVGMSMAELASAAPTSGGLYFWTHSLSSKRWRNLLAWIVGYANTIGSIAAIASIDWGCAVQVMAAATIGSRDQSFSATFAQTFLGSFDSSVHISEEASNAAIAVPWAIVGAISIAGILGWAINVSLAFCMGTDLDAIIDSSQPMAQIFFRSFGQKGCLAVWAFIVICQYMMGSSMVLAASRQSFAFARDGALPFSNWLYRMNGYTKTPVNTVFFTCGCAILLGLLSFAGSSAINAVFSLSITALYIAYSIPIAARFLGDNDFKPGPFSLGIFSAPVALIACSFMAFMFVVFLFPATPAPSVPDMNYAVVVLGGTMILSLVWYYFPVYGGVHWFTGPIPTLSDEDGSDASSDSMTMAKKEGVEVSTMQV